jgi:hypothetical protein
MMLPRAKCSKAQLRRLKPAPAVENADRLRERILVLLHPIPVREADRGVLVLNRHWLADRQSYSTVRNILGHHRALARTLGYTQRILTGKILIVSVSLGLT